MRHRAIMLCGALAAACMLQSQALAHRVNCFAWLDGGAVVVEGSFGKDRPAQRTTVTATIPGKDTVVFTGETNDAGEVRFPLPAEVSGHGLDIVLNAGDGHKGTWSFSAQELAGVVAAAETPQGAAAPVARAEAPEGDAAASSADPQKETTSQPIVTPQNEAALQALVQAAVRKEVAPLQRDLAHIKQELAQPGPTMQDIITGIGFLLGLGGVAAMVKRRV